MSGTTAIDLRTDDPMLPDRQPQTLITIYGLLSWPHETSRRAGRRATWSITRLTAPALDCLSIADRPAESGRQSSTTSPCTPGLSARTSGRFRLSRLADQARALRGSMPSHHAVATSPGCRGSPRWAPVLATSKLANARILTSSRAFWVCATSRRPACIYKSPWAKWFTATYGRVMRDRPRGLIVVTGRHLFQASCGWSYSGRSTLPVRSWSVEAAARDAVTSLVPRTERCYFIALSHRHGCVQETGAADEMTGLETALSGASASLT